MSRTAEHRAFVTILLGAPCAAQGVSGLGDFLIDDAVEVLFRVNVIVAVKDDVHVVLGEQTLNEMCVTGFQAVIPRLK